MPMIPTEPIGSIPRPKALIDEIASLGGGADPRLEPLYDAAIQDTVRQFEATGSPVITDQNTVVLPVKTNARGGFRIEARSGGNGALIWSADSDYRPPRWDAYRDDYRFTGKEEDVEVGLQYFGKRYLSAELGRWISPDPQALHEGSADPNLYAYVHGSVLHAVDPVGLDQSMPGGAPGQKETVTPDTTVQDAQAQADAAEVVRNGDE